MNQERRGVVALALVTTTALLSAVLAAATGFDNWSTVRNVSAVAPGAHQTLNTAANEGCPAVSPDGLALYFASNRDGTLDIWRSRRASPQQAWGAPEKLPLAINKPDSNEFCPTPFGDGSNLLFVSNKAGGCGAGDIYVVREHFALGWHEPVHLPCTVNSAGDEASPVIVQYDDFTLELFFSSTRPGGFSTAAPDNDADIYFSRLRADGSFGAVLLVDGVNTANNDSRPMVRRDGLEMYFDSDRPGSRSVDVWSATRSTPSAPWQAPLLAAALNSDGAETRPFLSWDGTQIYFGTTREGTQDLYVATRRDETPR